MDEIVSQGDGSGIFEDRLKEYGGQKRESSDCLLR